MRDEIWIVRRAVPGGWGMDIVAVYEREPDVEMLTRLEAACGGPVCKPERFAVTYLPVGCGVRDAARGKA